jgi:hypothetical protein
MSTDSAGLHADRSEGQPAWRNPVANQAFDDFNPHTKVVSDSRRALDPERAGLPAIVAEANLDELRLSVANDFAGNPARWKVPRR